MVLKTTALAGIIVLGLFFLFQDSHQTIKPIQLEKLNSFIKQEEIQEPNIIKLNPFKYYIFSEKTSTVYIYEGNENSHTTRSANRNGVVFGGLEKGSFGMIIKNKNILKDAHQYKVVIDGESKSYTYNKEKFLVVKDSKIWNPNPEIKIVFLDNKNKKILEETF